MNRVVGAIVIGEVTTGLIARSRFYAVIAVHMALRAGCRRIRVFARQGKARGAVVKGCVGPTHGVMTICASGRETGRDVIRNAASQSLGAVPICDVAAGVVAVRVV